MTDLVVFHYHFLPGGVSGVVQAAVRALRSYGSGIRRITLAGAAFPSSGFPGRDAELELQLCPELGYTEGRDPRSAAAAARRLAEGLLRRFGSEQAVWWVHNHHLGRNPDFTQAILEVARAGGQRLLLQIHDFPECGRYASLARLRRALTLPPYPAGPSVRYALINRRDLSVLRAAGLPESRLHLLENPLEREPVREAATPAEVKRALGLASARRLLLYPVRSIRRKNVLEAALLSRLAGADLAVTLPGVSAAERGYSRQVERAFARDWAPGVFGAGPRLEAQGLRLGDLFQACDLVVSSSLMEGFGYLFLQSLAWGRPLLARDLDVLDGMRALFENRPAAFYRELRAPLDARARQRLSAAYRGKLRRLARLELLPRPAAEELEGELAGSFGEPAVDYSFLPASWQLDLLREAGRSPCLAAQLQELNPQPLALLRRLLAQAEPRSGARPVDRELEERLEQRFGLKRFAEAFSGICRSFDRAPADGPAAADEAAVWDRVIRSFAARQNVRLLYGS